MGSEVMLRREVLTAGMLGVAALALPGWAKVADVPAAADGLDLRVGSRSTKLFAWSPARPRGVILFSHGHGSWPDRYTQLVAALNGDGFAVLAPVHVDSVHHPDRESFTLQQSFPERLADMAATSAYAARRFHGVPTIAAGHSFGTLTSLCLGGALAGMGRFRDVGVKAVLGFSTPGKLPGLIGPDAYTTVQVPVMIVTGTADTVPGFVTDPADHLFPAQTVPTASYALLVQGADHGLVAESAFARAAVPARAFVEAYGLGDRRALERLAAYTPAAGDGFTVRKGAS